MTGNLKVISSPIGTGKTTYIAKQIVESNHPIVYVTISYDQLNRIKSELSKIKHDKKIVELRGQEQNCIFPQRKMKCNGCPYNKKTKQNPQGNIYDKWFYQKQDCCPLLNCRKESKDADIILTHFDYIQTLYRTNPSHIPVNLEESILIMDEADKGIQNLTTKAWMIYEVTKDRIYPKLLELKNKNYMEYFEKILLNPELGAIEPKIPQIWQYFKNAFDITRLNHDELDEVIQNLESQKDEILKKMKKMTGLLNLYDFELWMYRTKFDLDEEIKIKNSIMDWIYMISSLQKFKIIKNKKGNYEVYLIPARFLIYPSAILQEFKEVWLASGSLTDSNLFSARMATNQKDEIVDYKIKKEFLQEHVLILVCNDYQITKLAYNLNKKQYLTYITHSSFQTANKFTRTVNKVITDTPKKLDDLKDSLSKGIITINLVQSSYNIASNNRLDGDVCIVNPNSFIAKDVLLYDLEKQLVEKSILQYTYQALGRVINSEKRPVVLVVPDEVYRVTKQKWDAVNATVKKVNQSDILDEITKWIPNSIGKDYSKKHQKIDRYKKFSPVKEKGKIKKARLVIEAPPQYVGTEAHITGI